jgi:23S rRNA (cytidine2498-2'-O)-methyltransferase
MQLFMCQNNYSHLLEDELKIYNIKSKNTGSSFLFSSYNYETNYNFCFPHSIMIETTEIKGNTSNEITNKIIDYFIQSIAGEKIETQWYLLFFANEGIENLAGRVNSVKKNFQDSFKKRMSRVSKLAYESYPKDIGEYKGLFVFFEDFNKVHVSEKYFFNGQKRMSFDSLAPSRSYLKVEEAYGILGYCPSENDLVVDLGAAPGGWSYSASKRSARVIAIDNGNMKNGAKDNSYIKHLKEDAFKFELKDNEIADWLFCDMIEDPQLVLSVIKKWIVNKNCRFFVINLKFGRTDIISLLKDLLNPESFFIKNCSLFRIRHLYHDREEFTLTGQLE